MPTQRSHLVLVHVNLQKHNVCQLFAQLLKRGGDLLARTAPCRREIDNHEGVLAVGENLFELGLRDNLLYLLDTRIQVFFSRRRKTYQLRAQCLRIRSVNQACTYTTLSQQARRNSMAHNKKPSAID